MSAEPKYRCIDCGKPAQRRRELGKSLRCFECGIAAAIEQNLQMAAHKGPWFDDWRRRSAAALGVVLDDGR